MSYNRKPVHAPIGAEYVDTHGYLIRKVATGYGGWQRVHRLVMAEKIGRPLLSWELVHHMNGDKLDNRPENLQVVTRAEHTYIHIPWYQRPENNKKEMSFSHTDSESAFPLGTERLHPEGYLIRKVATGYKGWKPVHRIIMEVSLDRPLRSDEIVHHINHNKLDNRLENLQLMTKTEHTQHHNKDKTPPPGNRRPAGKWAHKYDACTACGTTEIPHWAKGLCKACYPKAYISSYRERPRYYEQKQEYHRDRRKKTLLSSGRWAINYDACVKCGTTERRHVGHGLCVRCDARRRSHEKHHSK